MPRKKKKTIEETTLIDISEGVDVLLESSMNEVFDDAEIAQINNLREIETISTIARHLNKPETFEGFKGFCVDCDIKIPKDRLKLHKIRCVDCQQELEDNEKRKQGLSLSQKYIPAKIERHQEMWQQVSDNRSDDKLEDGD